MADDLAPGFLQIVIEQTCCDMAALVQRSGTDGEFITVRAIGHPLQSQAEVLLLPGVPAFLVLPGTSCPSHIQAEFQRAYGRGATLWSLNADTGLALILSSKLNSTVRQTYSIADRELIETAVALYVDLLSQRRVNRDLVSARQSADAQVLNLRIMAKDAVSAVSERMNDTKSLVESMSRVVITDSNGVNSHIDAIRSVVGQACDLLDTTIELIDSGEIPLNLEVNKVNVSGLINSVISSVKPRLLKTNLRIEAVPISADLSVSIDEGWMREILRRTLFHVCSEAEMGSAINLEVVRRSEGALSVVVRWDRFYPVRHSHTEVLDWVSAHNLAGEAIADTIRLADAYGATFIRETTGPRSEQIVLSMTPR